MIAVKRAYEPVKRSAGARLFVEQLLPCGLANEQGHAAASLRDTDPSKALPPGYWKRAWRRWKPSRTAGSTAPHTGQPRCDRSQ
jgi:uncharacterized protein YeaO (DUF488 family)